MIIEHATEKDYAEIQLVLEKCGMPHADGEWSVVRAGNCIIGVAGIVCKESGAILHSVAVVPGFRGLGLGRKLVEESLRWSAEHALNAMFIFTHRAEFYFKSMGFSLVDDDHYPESIALDLANMCNVQVNSKGHMLSYDFLRSTQRVSLNS